MPRHAVEPIHSYKATGFIIDAASHEKLNDEDFRDFLSQRAEVSRADVNFEKLENLVHGELRINMRNTNAFACM